DVADDVIIVRDIPINPNQIGVFHAPEKPTDPHPMSIRLLIQDILHTVLDAVNHNIDRSEQRHFPDFTVGDSSGKISLISPKEYVVAKLKPHECSTGIIEIDTVTREKGGVVFIGVQADILFRSPGRFIVQFGEWGPVKEVFTTYDGHHHPHG